MNDNLKIKTEEWMQLERKTIEQRKIAEEYYEKNLMTLIKEDYINRNKDNVVEDVKYLIVSVGTSYEPIVLNISLFNPDKIMFLCTEITESTIDKIVNECKLSATKYNKSIVSETDPLDIYKEIKSCYLKWNKPEKLYIDFTGGTKAMSAAAAMAGALIDVQLVYVGTNDYLTDFRKPNPGTETLFYITNPLAVFGDLEIEKALVLFEEHNYSGAKEKLEILKDTIPDPALRQQLNFSYLLAKAYEAWDSLDFEPAYSYMSQLCKELQRDKIHKNFLLMNHRLILNEQEKFLENLNKIPELLKKKNNIEILKNNEIIRSLMFTMYQNAITRTMQEKYDMATLLLYRLLEMIEQRRLSHYNLFVSQMEYLEIKINQKRQPELIDKSPEERLEILKTSVLNIKTQLFGKGESGFLPRQVSLLEGFIILQALHDPIVAKKDSDDINNLKRIRAMVFLRNNSIFAHGLGPVSKEDFMKFKIFVVEVFKRFCAIERIAFDEIENVIKMINPLEGK